MTHVRPEIVRTIGDGVPPALAHTLSNDPLINMDTRISQRISESKRIRLKSEKFRSTLHTCKEGDVVCDMLRFFRDFFRPLKNFLYGIGKWIASAFRE